MLPQEGKLDTVAVLISKVLIDPYITHDELLREWLL